MTSTLIMSSTSMVMMQNAQRIANNQIQNSIRNVIQSIILQIYQSIILSKQQQLDNIVDNEYIITDNDDEDSIVRRIKEVLKQFHSIFTLKLIELGYSNNNNIMEILQQLQEKDNEQMIRSTNESFRMNIPTNNNSQFVNTLTTTTTTLDQSNDICNSDTDNDDDDDNDLDDIIGSKARAATVTNNNNNNDNNNNYNYINSINENDPNQSNITTRTTTTVPFTAWAKLRQLGRDNSTNQYDILNPLPESLLITNSSNSYSKNIQNYIDILDTYGYNNDTYWIYNQWKYIDQYTKEQIDLRLHYISPLSNVSRIQQQQQQQIKQLQSHNKSNDCNNHNTLPVATTDNTNEEHHQQWDTKHLVSNALLSQHQNEYGQQQLSSSLEDNNTLPVENSNNTNQLETTTTHNNNNYNETIQQLIDRKRKSLHKKRKWDTTLQKFIPKQDHNNKKQNKNDNNNATISKVITLPEIPRYPSNDNGTTQLQWKRTINDLLLSDPNIVNDLNEYVHTNNSNDTTQQSSSSSISSDPNEQPQQNTNDSNTNSLLIGSVCEIGQFHCYQQQSCNIDNNNNNRSTTTTSNIYDNQTNIFDNLSEKQKKQYQRKAIRTRLGDHVPIRATDEIYQTNNTNANNTNKPWSRIVRTIATTKDNPIPYNFTTQRQQQLQEHEEISNERIEIELLKSQYYFDFDLGYCTLEIPTLVVDHPEQQQHQSRTVYTFSSIEVLLHD